MAVDISRQNAKGGDPQFDTGALRGVREERGIVTGIVKANVHPSHNGVIRIWVPSFSTDPNDKSQYRTVRYCTPYYSRVDNQGVGDTYFGTKVTSGIVTPPPDIGTKVLAFFPEGRNAEGYYFACVPDTFMLQTIPEATTDSNSGEAAGEFNDNPSGERDSKKITNWRKQNRPTDYFTQSQLVTSGLDLDNVRGHSTSSYMRESPSELIGISSKGRRITVNGQDFTVVNNDAIKDPETTDKNVLNGLLGPLGRRKGHSITLDDGDVDGNSNQIRLRTSTGHQILMNDTEGVIYVGNARGTVWIELNNTGTMDVFANDSINFRSKNINFHADQNIKFHSKALTQFVSEGNMHVEGKQQLVMTSAGESGITGSKGLHLNSGGELFATAGSSAYVSAGGIMAVSGAIVMLQGPKNAAKQAKGVSDLSADDIEFRASDRRYVVAQRPTDTTQDRLVTHEPFQAHGVRNVPTPYTGGLVGGGGGLGGAFSVIGAVPGLSAGVGALAGGAGGGIFSAVGGAGGLGGLGGVIGGAGGGVFNSVIGGGGPFAGAISSIAGGAGGGSIFSAISGGGGSIFSQITGGAGGGIFDAISGGIGGDVFGAIAGGGGFPGDILSSVTGGAIPGLGDIGGFLPGGLADGVLNSLSGGDIFSSLGTAIPGLGDVGGLGGVLGELGNVGGLDGILSGGLGDVIGEVGLGNLDIGSLSGQFPGLDNILPGGLADSVLANVGAGGFDLSQLSGSIGDIAGGQLPIGDLVGQFGGNFPPGELGKLVTDATGKITGISSELGIPLPGVGDAVNKFLPSLNDTLPDLFNSPVLNNFPVTDMLQQVNTGFSIGSLDTFDIQGLNAAVVKQVGSFNNPGFIDSVTKSVGKFGFNVDQLKEQGFVRPDAIFNDQLADSSVWTGKEGASSLSKFLGNGGLQEQVQQAVVATDYQKLFDMGGIKFNDSKPAIMGMLTASNISNVDVASAVRQGTSSLEGILKNTTNIPDPAAAFSSVQSAIQTGAAAATKVVDLKNIKETGLDIKTKLASGESVTEAITTTIGEAEVITNITETVSDVTESVVTGGESTVVADPVVGGAVTTAKAYDPYAGKNGGKIRDIDNQIAQLEEQRFNIGQFISKEQEEGINNTILALYSQRDKLQKA